MTATTIDMDGKPTMPSFRVGRGEAKIQLDIELGLIAIMHPYDIVQGLAEAGNISQALWALDGFLRREIDIKVDAAMSRIHRMYR